MSRKSKARIGMGVAAAMLGIMTVVGISSRGANSTVAEKTIPVAVEVSPVRTMDLMETVSAVGTVTAMNDVTVSSETAGRITRVLVKVGDFVKQGQPLVIVDDELKAIAVEQARAHLIAADASHRKAASDFERAEALFANGDISSTELEAYRLGLRSAEAGFKSAEVGLRHAQRQLDDTRIKSPVSGYVASRMVDLGEMVTSGKEIANIVNMSQVRVKLSIPEEDILKLEVGQPATVRIDSRPDIVLNATVYSVGRKSESNVGHTYPVEVVVKGPEADILKVGMFARVEVVTTTVIGAVAITKEALAEEAGQYTVYVVEGNTALLRPVKVGVRSGQVVQVVEGLNGGEMVISFGQKKLKDGSSVQYALSNPNAP
jgi:RND family efflux transporter MFP subunit